MAEMQETTTASGSTEGSQAINDAIANVDSSKGSNTSSVGAGTEQAAPEIPTYTPNYKFKVMDQEKEFDPWIRGAIKDAETEKKVKELYEKAYGLDYVKPKYEQTQKEYGNLSQQYQSLYNDANEAMYYKRQGDLDAFFEKVQLQPEKVYQWVLDKIQRQNLPPEQQRVYNELEQRRRAEFQASGQMQEMQQQYHAMASQAREAEVNSVLARNDIHPIVQAYDAKNGPGAFRHFVAEYGVMHYNVHGQDPTAQQAVDAVMKRLGDAYRSGPTNVASPASGGEKPLPVIPNVAGKAVSPTRKSPRSIDDLRKLAQEAGA